jgi:6-pyruvoyltetrahydropterin/6-carboxytetrahydropterin synthase
VSDHRIELRRSYSFEAAHSLPNVPSAHKCARVHGHSYRIDIVVEGSIDSELGWLIDFAAIDEVARPVIEALDHRYLNELPGLENPTSENIAIHIWSQLGAVLPDLSAIIVCENERSSCTYRGQR